MSHNYGEHRPKFKTFLTKNLYNTDTTIQYNGVSRAPYKPSITEKVKTLQAAASQTLLLSPVSKPIIKVFKSYTASPS